MYLADLNGHLLGRKNANDICVSLRDLYNVGRNFGNAGRKTGDNCVDGLAGLRDQLPSSIGSSFEPLPVDVHLFGSTHHRIGH